jgi:type I restriction enzyme S subunit
MNGVGGPIIGLEHIESETGRIISGAPTVDYKITSAFDQRHVLYGKLRPYLNKVALPDFRGRCTTEIIPLLPADQCDREWLAWILRRPETVEAAMGEKTGTRMPRADMNHLLRLPIPLPPLPEQHRIAAVLCEALDAVRRAREAALARLEAARGLPAAFLRSVFESEEARSWPRVRLAEACESILTGPFGSSLHESDYIAGGIPVINPQNIVNGAIVKDDNKTVSTATQARLKQFALQENDVVIGRRGEMGRCGVAKREMEGWICGTGCFAIRMGPKHNPLFGYLQLSSPRIKAYLEEKSVGMTLMNLNQRILSEVTVAQPPIKVQAQFVAAFEETRQCADQTAGFAEGQLAAINAFPQSLLRRAFAGEL